MRETKTKSALNSILSYKSDLQYEHWDEWLKFVSLPILFFLVFHTHFSFSFPPFNKFGAECEFHCGAGLGVRSPEAHTEEGRGDQGSWPVQDPTAAAGQTRQVCFFKLYWTVTLSAHDNILLPQASPPKYSVNPGVVFIPFYPAFLMHLPFWWHSSILEFIYLFILEQEWKSLSGSVWHINTSLWSPCHPSGVHLV